MTSLAGLRPYDPRGPVVGKADLARELAAIENAWKDNGLTWKIPSSRNQLPRYRRHTVSTPGAGTEFADPALPYEVQEMTTTEARKHLLELVNMAALRPIEGSRWSDDTPVAVNLPW